MKHLKNWLKGNAMLFSFVLSLCLTTTYAQQTVSSEVKEDFCHTDELLQQSLAEDPQLQEKIDERNKALRNYIDNYISQNPPTPAAQAAAGGGSGSANYVIPTVIYIVHNNGVENITDLQVHSQLDKLNSEFSAHGISFCLATEENGTALPGTGPDPGIIRIQSTLTDHQTSAEASLKALSTLPADRYLRIWVVEDINNGSGIVGYARFPGTVPPALEGIVMRYDVFGDVATCGCTNLLPSNNQGKVLAHEVGHYLDLYHTFHGGCAGTTAGTCATQGDLICDTPPVAVANTGCPSSPVNSCTETPTDNNDLLDNHMDYTNDNCRNNFTTGQETRMVCAINMFRSTLVSSQNLVYTGVQCNGGILAAFSASSYNPCDGDNVTFTATSQTGVTYTWDFGDGSATVTGNPVTHSYTPGGTTYSATLTVTDGTNTVSESQDIYVSDCSPIASSQGHWYFGKWSAIDFSTGTAVPNNSASVPQTINNHEGCVAVSDNSGNLLFYADDNYVWDNTHTALNTTAFSGNFSSAAQIGYAPDPANSNRYYVFIPPAQEDLGSAIGVFRYVLVDLSSSTVTGPFNIPTPTGITYMESVTIVPHCNTTDYWVIVHGRGNTNAKFYVYRLSSTGLSNGTNTSSFPDQYPNTGNFAVHNSYYAGSQLEASPDGSKLAYPGNGVGLYDFNRSTGAVTNELQIDGSVSYYGCSFSPQGQYVYASAPSTGGFVKQFDLTGSEINNFSGVYAQLQNGPDGKLYLNPFGISGSILAGIPNPDATSPTLIPTSVNFTPVSTSIWTILGLPNMIDAAPATSLIEDFTYSIVNCNEVHFDGPQCYSSYLWDFGDMTSSNVEDPTHTYASDGTYTVTLTLNGSIVITKTITIGVSSAIAGPTTVCLDDANIFNYSSSATGSGLIYSWSATGGTIGLNGNDNVDVTWTSLPGTLTLTVTDPATGCTSTTTINVVEDCSGGCDVTPNYYISISAKDHCVHLFTDATIVGSDCSITSWFWDFGDGSTSTLQNPAHAFPTNGVYTVCLTVTAICNGQVCTETICYKVPVDYCDPCEDFKPYFYVAIGEDRCTMYFTDATPVPDGCYITSWFWDFGDGTTSTLQNPMHTYTGNGLYNVCLTVTIQCGKKICKETYCLKIPVEDCEAKCELEPNFYQAVSIKNACTFIFTDATTIGSDCNIIAWHWDFGDGTTSSLQNPVHTFPASGIYNVCLTVTAICGNQICVETICMPAWVLGCDKKCDIYPDYLIAIDPDRCTFYFSDNSSLGAGCSITGWTWDFGDGNFSTAQNPTHTYSANGTYTVCLTITANCNGVECVETICYDVMVNGCNPCPCGLAPNFSFSTNECKVQFNNNSLTNGCTQITGYSWDFGDGNTSTAANPSHTYSGSGTYTVCLTIYGHNGYTKCTETICYEVDVDCDPCNCEVYPNFSYNEANCVVQFSDLSTSNSCTSITSWFWDFGDGNTSTSANPTHVYASSGVYGVCLTIEGFDGNDYCEKTYCYEVEAECEDCPCDIEANYTYHVEKCTVDFYDLSAGNMCTSVLGWFWDFGDGNTSSSANPIHTYSSPGVYEVCLTTYGSNGSEICKDEICFEIEVKCEEEEDPDRKFEGYKSNASESIFSMYPNPFSDQLNIDVDLDVQQQVSIQIFDSYGKHIAEIIDENLGAGKHALKWQPTDANLASGMYIVTIKSDTGFEYKKVTFNK